MTTSNDKLNQNQNELPEQREDDDIDIDLSDADITFGMVDEAEEVVPFPGEGGAVIKVIGVGGGGCKPIECLALGDIKNIGLAALSTDGKALGTLRDKIGPKTNLQLIQIGPKRTRGLGAGTDPKEGELAAEESQDEIRQVLKGCDMVFITVGLGGGTGTGAAPLVARIAKDLDILTVGVATTPFHTEGMRKWRTALEGMKKLLDEVDSLILIQNQQIARVYGDSGLVKGYGKSDEMLVEAVQGISDLIRIPGDFGGLDFADIRTCLRDKGLSIISVGTAKASPKCVEEALNNALHNPMLENCVLENAQGMVANIFANQNMQFSDHDLIRERLNNLANDDAITKTGLVTTNDSEEDSVRIVLVVSGITMDGLAIDSRPDTKKDGLVTEPAPAAKKVPEEGDKNTTPSKQVQQPTLLASPSTKKVDNGDNLDHPAYDRPAYARLHNRTDRTDPIKFVAWQN